MHKCDFQEMCFLAFKVWYKLLVVLCVFRKQQIWSEFQNYGQILIKDSVMGVIQ